MEKTVAGLTADEEQEYISAITHAICPECGKPILQKPRGRKKKFCSDACRFTWKYRHENPDNWKTTRSAVCPVCGKEFPASREYQRKRKYCSRSCANRGRAKQKKNTEENRDET